MELRELYYDTVRKIYSDRLSFENLYPDILSDLEDREKRRLVNLVNQFFRNFNIIERFLIKKIDKNISEQKVTVSIMLLCAAVEYYMLDSSKDYSVVHSYVELTKKKLGTAVSRYVNAILRKMTGLTFDKEYLTSRKALFLSHPQWVTDKLIASYGKDKTQAIYRFNQTVPKIYLRANRMKNGREELSKELKKEGVETSPTEVFSDFLTVEKGNAVGTKAFKEGFFYIQDPPHSLPVYIIDPKSGEKVLDLCCAPGGKSTFIQEISGNKTYLHLNDASKEKHKTVNSNFERLGLNYDLITSDPAEIFKSFDEFDKVLVDVPCTGSGNFRRHPESRWNKDEEMLQTLTKLQLSILKRASIYVRPGGSMVYSTCSVFKEENMDIVKAFLDHDPDYRIDKFIPAGLENFAQKNGSFFCDPGGHGFEGAFAVRLKRVR